MNRNKSLIVLGIGNSVRMDDGAGIRVVEDLEKDTSLSNLNINFKYLSSGGIDVLDAIDGYKHAIIVDAASVTTPKINPGEFFHISDVSGFKIDNIDQGISSHSIGILSGLKYAEIGGYDVPSKIEIYGIQIKETGFFSEELTPEVAAGVDQLKEVIKNYIIKLFNKSPF